MKSWLFLAYSISSAQNASAEPSLLSALCPTRTKMKDEGSELRREGERMEDNISNTWV
jgi:hypothetical protein